uniref:Uncharacterized protein n=2 Tax=Denticeps clupeoides TaxID=299321 RepID=A0AAY4BB00_9TELE
MSNSSQTPAPNVSTTVSTSSPKPASPTNQRVPAIQTSHTSTTLLPVVHRTFTTTAAPATSVRVPSPGQPQPAATDQSSPAPTSTSPALHTATAAQSRPPDAPTPPGGEGPVRGSVEEQLAAHLLDTSSLLALLLFGLLFFAVTVAMFTSQAYKSYKRKDYTQVDYLINGMYADSGV